MGHDHPGANPYAPGGKSPAGSAGWYTQSRATPGAFPVPAETSDPSTARVGPPVYQGSGDIPATIPPIKVATRFTPPPTRPDVAPRPDPIAAAPIRTVARPVASSMPSAPPMMSAPPPPTPVTPRPTPIAVSHTSAGPVAGPMTPPPTGDGLVWRAVAKPTQARPQPRVEIVPTGAEPGPLPASVTMSTRQLEGIVLKQCENWVKDVQVTTPGAGKVVVEFAAFSESHAHAAAEAVSRVPELRGFEVSFVARIAKP